MKNKETYRIEESGLRCHILNSKGEIVHILGRELKSLMMPSAVDIENLLEEKFPGCEVHGYVKRMKYGSTYVIDSMTLPTGKGEGNNLFIEIECDEQPIDGDYENGWMTSITVGCRPDERDDLSLLGIPKNE